jgi:peptidoglycan hydrolase-like protein with peptidoglycan-binding domain
MAVRTYKKGSDIKLSENFSVYEFACKGNGCCTETPIDDQLVTYLQMIRDHFGAKVEVSCGHRCEIHNAEVPNAATRSRHIYGLAADIHLEGVDPIEVARYAETIGVKGIGHYDTFVHIDTRTEKSFWYSHAQVRRTTFQETPAESPATDYSLEQFVKDVQKACGATVDGIVGPETMGKTVTLSSKKNSTHEAVRAVQKRLKVLGYVEVGNADGIAGPKFTSAVAHFQQDNGCVVDGEITAGKKTWSKLLGVSA